MEGMNDAMHGDQPPDLRLVFLHRATARLALVYSADMTLDEAIGGLVEPFEELIGRRILCDCARDIVERWDRNYRLDSRRRPKQRRLAA